MDGKVSRASPIAYMGSRYQCLKIVEIRAKWKCRGALAARENVSHRGYRNSQTYQLNHERRFYGKQQENLSS